MRPCTVGIIQARLASDHLPLKALLTMHGAPLIDWVLERAYRCKSLDKVVIAIPDASLDDILMEHLEEAGAECIRGSEDDVLSRLLEAARWAEASEIVRIRADAPLTWWAAVDRLVDFYKNTLPDYAYNHIPVDNTWPTGLGAEIASREVLENVAATATSAAHREDCFGFIWDNPGKFSVATFNPAEGYLKRPEINLTVDTVQDFERLARLPIQKNSGAREIIQAWAC